MPSSSAQRKAVGLNAHGFFFAPAQYSADNGVIFFKNKNK